MNDDVTLTASDGTNFTYAGDTVDPTLCTEPTVARLLAADAKNVRVLVYDDENGMNAW